MLVINPGTGPVDGAAEKHAIENMKHYVIDTGISCYYVRIPEKDYGEGRYAFLVWLGNECHEIQMPGLPLEKVRFMGNPDQDVWQFPRLYVDDSSWLWLFAIQHVFDGVMPANNGLQSDGANAPRPGYLGNVNGLGADPDVP